MPPVSPNRRERGCNSCRTLRSAFDPLQTLARSCTFPWMTKKKFRSPQERKALSYAKDRRNTYGENDKASRKAIPLRKAQESRKDRHKVAQGLAILPRLDEEAADLIESSARHDVHRVGGWKKAADDALGKVLTWALEARENRAGRKARSRARREEF